MRALALLLGAALLGAAAPPPVPEAIAPFVKDGHLPRDDYAWLRGAAGDASPSDKAAWRRVADWQNECFRRSTEAVRAEFKALGADAKALPLGPYGEPLCAEAGFRPFEADLATWAGFEAALAEARPAAGAFLYAVDLAGRSGTVGDKAPLSLRLPFAVVPEQMLRKGYDWQRNAAEGAPRLSPAAARLVDMMLGAEMQRRDLANTRMLKDLVAKQGWPKVSEVGAPASQAAWLIVQHADGDPVFQLEALRLMEPLMASGEVSRQNVAYLYDRVMLKIAGKQRYGTQFTCRDHGRVPLPLEDEAGVDRLRAAADLPPLAEYAAFMEQQYGKAC